MSPTEQLDSADFVHEKPEVLHTSDIASESDQALESYRITWRTAVALFALSLCWSSTTLPTAGANPAIAYMVASFPDQAANATWIANAVLFGYVTVPILAGATSDRYGKKWFMIAGGIIGAAGAAVAGRATSINMIIGGQAIIGFGAASALVCVPTSMEIVPAKYRAAAFGVMAIFTAGLGSIGSPLIFAAFVDRDPAGDGEGWRYGFYIEIMVFLFGMLGILAFYNPPPTRYRREQTARELLKTIDFVGIFILALGGALLVIPLVWGGNKYDWGNAHVVSLLVIAPLIFIVFAIYEWKGRKDGIMHHDFFASLNFPILMGVGILDGILLYSTGYFIPNQIRALYTTDPFDIIVLFTAFPTMVSVGIFLTGLLITKSKQIRLPLLASCVLTTLFCGLMIRCEPGERAYFIGITAALGFMTAAITTVPVAGIALVVPSHLIATSNTLLTSVRALGGAIGIAIFTAVFGNKLEHYFATDVIPMLGKAGIPAEMYSDIVLAIQNAPQALAKIPGFTPEFIEELLVAAAKANADSYRYVWICITATAGACAVGSLFIKDVPERMTNQVESALEISKLRAEQDHVV